MAVLIFKPFGAIGVAGMWLVISYILARWGVERSLTISQHVGKHKLGYGIYAVLSTVFLALFFCFSVLWFCPYFNLPTLAAIVIGIATTATLVAAWIPDRMRKDWMTIVHRTCAYTMALLLPVFVLFIAVSPNIQEAAKGIAWLEFGFLLILTCILSLSRKARSFYLTYQIIYLASFHATVLTAAYIR